MYPHVKVIQPAGILDSTQISQFRGEVDDGVKSGATLILVDLREITFIDSSGLGALVTALKTVRSAGGELCVCSINEQVKILFELTSMDRVFEIFSSQDEFIQSLAKQPNYNQSN